MEKAKIKKLEIILRRYYKGYKTIEIYSNEINKLKSDIQKIDKDKREFNVSIPVEYGTSSFGERVQTSSSGMSAAERQLERCIDIFDRRIESKLKEIEELEDLLDRTRKDYLLLSRNIENLDEESKELLIEKYKKGKSNREMAFKLHKDESVISRKYKKILKEILKWEFTLMYDEVIVEQKVASLK